MIRKKLRELIARIATQGITPHKLSLTIALGVTVGIIPLLWGSTIICVLLAFAFRLNQAGIQAVNYLAYPLQIILLVPFYRLGARLFPAATVTTGISQSAQEAGLATATGKALVAWLLVAPPTTIFVYLVVLVLLTRTHQE